MLSRQDVYSHQRCNNGYCVYLYAYYFTKDKNGTSAIDASGHTHDWEHFAVWVDNETEKVFAVGASVGIALNLRRTWDIVAGGFEEFHSTDRGVHHTFLGNR